MRTVVTSTPAPTLSPRRVWPLVTWSFFVWGSRIRNIWADDDLDTAGQVGRTALALSFVVPALAIGWALARGRGCAVGGRLRAAVVAFAGWTVAVWVLRGIQILAADHDTDFKVVHTVLAVVSIGLAALAVGRSVGRSALARR